jgi:hypothetical protein
LLGAVESEGRTPIAGMKVRSVRGPFSVENEA